MIRNNNLFNTWFISPKCSWRMSLILQTLYARNISACSTFCRNKLLIIKLESSAPHSVNKKLSINSFRINRIAKAGYIEALFFSAVDKIIMDMFTMIHLGFGQFQIELRGRNWSLITLLFLYCRLPSFQQCFWAWLWLSLKYCTAVPEKFPISIFKNLSHQCQWAQY